MTILSKIRNLAHAVERCGIEGGVDVVSTGDGVRGQEGNDLSRREATCVLKAFKDGGDAVLGLGDETLDGRGGRIGTTCKEFQTRCTLFTESV